MKITKRGKIAFRWMGDWKCKDCGCEWKMESNDPAPKYNSDKEGTFYSMNCPECNRTSYFYPGVNSRGQW